MVRAQNCYGIVMVSGDGDGDGDVGGGVDSPLFCQANPVMVVMMMIMVSNPVMVDAHSQHDTSETHV